MPCQVLRRWNWVVPNSGRPSPHPQRDDHRHHPVLVLGADVEEAGSLRRAEPLVQVAGVAIGADRLHVERDLTRGVGAVDHGEDAGLAGAAADLLDREDQGAE